MPTVGKCYVVALLGRRALKTGMVPGDRRIHIIARRSFGVTLNKQARWMVGVAGGGDDYYLELFFERLLKHIREQRVW